MRRNNHRSFAGFSRDRWGHLYILSQLLSRARSSPYTIQLTAHCPPRIFINPTSNCSPSSLIRNLKSSSKSSFQIKKICRELVYIWKKKKYIPFIALEFILKRKNCAHFNFAQSRYFIRDDRSFHRRKNFINRGNSQPFQRKKKKRKKKGEKKKEEEKKKKNRSPGKGVL